MVVAMRCMQACSLRRVRPRDRVTVQPSMPGSHACDTQCARNRQFAAWALPRQCCGARSLLAAGAEAHGSSMPTYPDDLDRAHLKRTSVSSSPLPEALVPLRPTPSPRHGSLRSLHITSQNSFAGLWEQLVTSVNR